MGAAGLNVGFAIIQVAVGIAIGSVVVLADAAHQVVDAVGLLTALGALMLARRPASERMSFGWGKADALGGFTSGLLLLGSIVWIGYEAVSRLLDPTDVEGASVIVIGLIAMLINGGSLVLLGNHGHGHAHQHSHDEHGHGHGHSPSETADALSIQAARLHLITDLAGSAAVVLAGVILATTGWPWVDPAFSLLVSVVVLGSTVGLMRRSVAELLDRVPPGLHGDAVTTTLRTRPEVRDVHHIHLRPLGSGETSVTAHVVIDGELSVHEGQEEIDALTDLLASELGITHATIQLECHPCGSPQH